VNFAAYLDVNQTALKKCEGNITRLESDNAEKRKLIEKQKIKLEVYRQQNQAIKRETEAVAIYQDYLQKVRNDNPDEYGELKDILSRYRVLIKSSSELKARQQELANQLETKQDSVDKQEQELKTQILTLNTELLSL
jgi:chromosome segregation ATPase